MKKKIVSVLLTAVMAASLLAGCGNSSKPAESTPAEPAAPAATEEAKEETPADTTAETTADAGAADYSDVTLTFWSMWNSTEPQGKVIQEAADAFKEQTGATVNIEWKGRDINTIIATALESGEKIDIFEDDYSRIAKTYVNYCYDLTEMAKAANYDAQSFKCFNDVATEWAGFLCCVTEQPQVGGVFYNKDIFDDCGITSVPATWDEFLTACQAMVDKGYQPLALDSAYADFTFGYHLDRVIGQDAITDLALNGGWGENKGVAEAAQQIIDFVKAGYLADGAPDEYPSQAAFDFLMLLTSGEFDQKMADAASQIPADPRNTAPAIMNGTIEALQATDSPLTWNMGLNENADLKANFKDIIIGLFEGKYATGEDFAAAMDALY